AGSPTSSPTCSSTGAPTYFSTNLSVTPETPTAITAKPVQPTGFALDQNYPNPFNPTTQIAFSIPAQMHVSVTIFNILGEKVATLVNANLSAGEHLLTWNALNQNGEMMPTGVYFYRLSTPTFTAVKKMLLLK
ncbi:MAG: T9SS type A sorting domain-containing protein, partial [Bacteroidetes bacterium]|nr:T9SS type A sorting domain-containing protein [Bacteroidota bacterium]